MKKILLFCSLAVFLLSLAISAQAATVAPKPMVSQWGVIKLFQTAMANRYADLNSNAKSGAQGVYDYIIGDGTAGSVKITKEMVNTNTVYAKTALEQLDWFKTEFIKNTDKVLNQRDKDGIKYGMSRRYSDICAVEWNAAIKNLTKIYNTAVANAEKARKGVKAKAAVGATPAVPATGEELCNFNYNRDSKDPAKVPVKSSDYDNAIKRFIALEQLNNEKSVCVNATYTAFYAAKTAALSAFTAAKTAATTGSDAKYTACIGDRISAWTWVK